MFQANNQRSSIKVLTFHENIKCIFHDGHCCAQDDDWEQERTYRVHDLPFWL